MTLSQENRVLLYCCQTNPPEVTLDQIRKLISSTLNWDDILGSAFRHGVAPLLYINLGRADQDHIIPQEVMDRLHKAYLLTTARNMQLYAQLRIVLEAFHHEGIEVIVLKGAALAETVYRNIGLRSMGDIDLLVKDENLSRAEKIMINMGYVASTYEPCPDWYNEKHFHLPPFFHSETGVKVEVHWHVVKPSKPFHANMIERFWKRAKAVNLAKTQALVLAPEDQLFHLCMHCLAHGFTPKLLLRKLCDISETLKCYKKEFNWIQFQNEIIEYKLNKFIHSTLYLIRNLIGNSDTDEVLNRTERSIDPRLVELMERQIFASDNNSCIIYTRLIEFLAGDKFQDKVKILINRVYPPLETISEWYSVPLSSKTIYFYYLIRPYKLILKYGSLFFTIFQFRDLARIFLYTKFKSRIE